MSLKTTQVFISYRKKNGETPAIAREIATTLEQAYGYQVFLDIARIPTAAEWEKLIYENIYRSDVLIVLMDAETADSQWVQREVDVARGAHVSILPLAVVDPKQINILSAAEKLAIANLQYSQHFRGTEADYALLVKDIERLTKNTRDAQKHWMEETVERWRVRPPIDHVAQYRTFSPAPFDTTCKLHLAVGDLLRMGSFDVIVNSENTYMQMARYYEYTTLSSQLRRLGSREKMGRIIEDTLQDELNQRITKLATGRPIPLTQVIATYAGHESSQLRKKARYIFHAATVSIAAEEAAITVTPLNTSEGIRRAVVNCLEKTLEVNRDGGLPPLSKSGKKTNQQPAEPIRSIIFPMFGTGKGGLPVSQVAPAMVTGVYEFLRQSCHDPHFTLTDIHLCAYSAAEVNTLEKAMKDRFNAD